MKKVKCLICGADVFTSAERDICRACADTDASAVVDHIAKLTDELARLRKIEAAARAIMEYEKTGGETNFADWEKYYSNLYAALNNVQ